MRKISFRSANGSRDRWEKHGVCTQICVFPSNFSGVSAQTLNLGFEGGVRVELGGVRVVVAFFFYTLQLPAVRCICLAKRLRSELDFWNIALIVSELRLVLAGSKTSLFDDADSPHRITYSIPHTRGYMSPTLRWFSLRSSLVFSKSLWLIILLYNTFKSAPLRLLPPEASAEYYPTTQNNRLFHCWHLASQTEISMATFSSVKRRCGTCIR